MEICGVLEGVVEGVATADVAAGGQEVAVLPTEEVGVAQATCNQRMEEVVNVYILCGGCDMLRSSVRECVVCALQEQVKALQEEVKGLKGVVDEGNVGTGMLVSTMQGEVKDLQQKVHSLEEGVEVWQAGVVTRPASGGTRPKEGEWRVVGKGSKPGSAGAEKSGEVPLHNRYAVLGEEDMGVKSRGVEEQQAGDRSGKGPEVVLVGDSQVTLQDSLPHHVCGPCLAKLDEVVDFMDVSQATQSKLKNQLRECTTETIVQVNEDKLYELIQDVKVELEESDRQYMDDLNDEDYGPHSTKRQRRKAGRGLRARGANPRGQSGKQPKKVKSKDAAHVAGDTHEQALENTAPLSTPVKAEEWMENNSRQEAAAEACVQGRLRDTVNPLSSCDKLDNSVKTSVRCSLCKSSFSQVEHLASHSLEAHQVAEPSYLCPQCPQIFSKISSLKNHQRRKHQESLQTCPQCNKLYPAHYLWTRHMLVHTNSRPFSCDKCEKKFKSKAELINHQRIHRPSEERYTHCCEVCGKRFTQKANLDSHLRLHTGNRPFSCEFCGKCFSQRGNLEEHRRIHTGEKPFVCATCGVSYSRQGQLAMHRRQHTGEKPHKCQYCEKEFLRREVLKKHEHMHTDTRPYKCSYCEKSFRDQGKRKVHERLHTGERPFECQFCGRGFCESGNLRKHLRVHQHRPGSAASSSTQDKSLESVVVDNGPPQASSGGSSFHFNPAPNTTFNVQGLVTSQHGADITTVGNTATLVISEPVPLPSVNSHPTTQTQEAPPPLPLLGNMPSTLPPQECDGEDYRVTSSYQPITTWSLYHA